MTLPEPKLNDDAEDAGARRTADTIPTATGSFDTSDSLYDPQGRFTGRRARRGGRGAAFTATIRTGKGELTHAL